MNNPYFTVLFILVIEVTAIILGSLFDNQIMNILKKKYFKQIIIPVMILVIIGIILQIINFQYIEQYITLCGPIIAACVTYYVALFNNDISIEKDRKEKILFAKNVYILLKGGQEALISEIDNYNNYIKNVKSAELDQKPLATTPFTHFSLIQKTDSKLLYSAIMSIKDKDLNNLESAYLSIIKQCSNALFVKENSVLMYESFINAFNVSANRYVQAGYELNNLYVNLKKSPSSDKAFNIGFFKITDNYNIGVKISAINENLISDVFKHLHNPLVNLAVTRGITNPEMVNLLQIMKSFEVNLNKMAENRKNSIDHFTDLINDLQEIDKNISSILEIISTD